MNRPSSFTIPATLSCARCSPMFDRSVDVYGLEVGLTAGGGSISGGIHKLGHGKEESLEGLNLVPV